eukprot:CAMPEP_0197445014 /NCGR_PEP_ID=MMETSP1175-20131217/10332_1 /TAXON_ID=1003142 /ORGANISM="Triceratium dubium, Strain CCMP147" /LENGTH=274 /DNA_ID=CAMNT_0042975901 /DNA_START=67 /DNA_END=891 /DNA_ORIENTATION=+
MAWTQVQACGVVALLCSAWNLFGDLYFLDFYAAHMDEEDQFGSVRAVSQPGNLFRFDDGGSSFGLVLAQAGGWMYPLWACATTLPLYKGLRGAGFWSSVAPCAVLAYGLCVVGGALHSAFSFLTVLPNAYHHPASEECEQMTESSTIFQFLQTTQTTIVRHLIVGCLPGYIACNVASAWIFFVVFTKSHQIKFPKWFNLFNPFVTMAWVAILSSLLPDPWAFYIFGSLGTWGVLILNLGLSYFLWDSQDNLFPVPTENTCSGSDNISYGSVSKK